MSTLKKAFDILNKNKAFDKESIVLLSTQEEVHPHISTGSVAIDYLIGGSKITTGEKICPGIPRGKITEVFGPEGSGKSTLAVHTAIECQRKGGTVCYLDYEHTFHPEYARSLGLNLDSETFMLFQPPHWEEGALIIETMSNAGVDLIVVDSVAAMKPQKEVEGDITSSGQVGHLARLQSSFLARIVRVVKKNGTALIYINQLRSRIKMSMYDSGPSEETSGGNALKYYASVRISLKRKKTEYLELENALTGKKEKQSVSNLMIAKNVKNKISSHQGHTTEFVIRYGEGIDNIRTLIEIAKARKVIKGTGAWVTITNAEGEAVKINGTEALRTHLLNNMEDYRALVNSIGKFTTGVPAKIDTTGKELIEEDNEDYDEVESDYEIDSDYEVEEEDEDV